MRKYKEGGHERARRLNLKKPHIMYCPYMKQWLLGAHCWEDKDVSEEHIDKAIEFYKKLNGEL